MSNLVVWKKPPSPLTLLKDEIHLWRVSLSKGSGLLKELNSALLTDEKERAERFHFEKDRMRFSLSRAVLRWLLGSYLKEDPSKIRLEQNSYGKPLLKNPPRPLRFNLSHSGELILLAFAMDHEVGVDVERFRETADFEKIAHRYFSRDETEELFRFPPEKRREAFFTFWALKEAYLKAKGRGIAMGLDSFSVFWKPDREKASLKVKNAPEESEGFTLLKFSPCPDHVGALAVEGRRRQLLFFDFPQKAKDLI